VPSRLGELMLPLPTRCCFPLCSEFGGHQHHVTYDPECKKPLCGKHHKEITHLNGIQSRKYNYAKLTNKFRWWIWFQWIEGRLKARRTKLAQEWTKEWDKKATIVISTDPPPLPIPCPPKPKRASKKRAAKKKPAARKGATNGRRVDNRKKRGSRSKNGKGTVRKLST
jgi:hypothetical protein